MVLGALNPIKSPAQPLVIKQEVAPPPYKTDSDVTEKSNAFKYAGIIILGFVALYFLSQQNSNKDAY